LTSLLYTGRSVVQQPRTTLGNYVCPVNLLFISRKTLLDSQWLCHELRSVPCNPGDVKDNGKSLVDSGRAQMDMSLSLISAVDVRGDCPSVTVMRDLRDYCSGFLVSHPDHVGVQHLRVLSLSRRIGVVAVLLHFVFQVVTAMASPIASIFLAYRQSGVTAGRDHAATF